MKKPNEAQSRRNAKTTTKIEPKVTFSILSGPISPAQREAWRKFWSQIISQAKADIDK